MAVVRHKEAIHSGHFMVSEFEAEAQDEDDISVVPPPEEVGSNIPQLMSSEVPEVNHVLPLPSRSVGSFESTIPPTNQRRTRAIIDISLNKLFQSMKIAYRQKFTSPKWNRFRGLKLRMKDKMRLNNVIWRCWHMQFIKCHRRLLFTFENPLEIDHHNRTEGSTVLEGKYWKRKVDAVKNEYKKWRRFYLEPNHSNLIGHDSDEDRNRDQDPEWDALFQRSPFQFLEGSKDDVELESMLSDEGVMLLLNATNPGMCLQGNSGFSGSESFFSGNNYGNGSGNIMLSGCMGATVPFPNPKDTIYKNTMNADFIQPGLGQLQPNLEDFTIDFNFLGDLFNPKSTPTILPPIQEQEQGMSTLQAKDKLKCSSNVSMLTPASPNPPHLNPSVRDPASETVMQRFNDSMDQTNYVLSNAPAMLPPHLKQQENLGDLSIKVTRFENGDQQNSSLRGPPRYAVAMSPPLYLESKVMTAVTQPIVVERQINQSELFAPQQQIISYYPNDPSQLNQHKMRSPKHKFLQQREYLAATTITATAAAPQTLGLNYYSPRSPQPNGGLPISHPSFATQSQYHHPTRVAPYTFPTALPVRGQQPAVQNPSSELLQLLKSTVPASVSGAKSESMATDLSMSRYDAFASPAPRRLGSSIPPPLSSDLPQSLATSGVNGSINGHDDPMGQRSRQNYRGLTHTPQYQEHRRSQHINAEQNRRHSIKHGFETLRSLVPSLNSTPSSMKTSKAALLMKGGDYLQQLKTERDQLVEQAAMLRTRLDQLNVEVSEVIALLPSGGSLSGLSGGRKKRHPEEDDTLRMFFDSHARRCTEINWKYWIFSCLMRPLFDSYRESVTGSNFDEMARSVINWMDGQCAPPQLRQNTLNTLRDLSLKTDILVCPQQLPQEALAAVHNVKLNKTSPEPQSRTVKYEQT